MKTLLLFLFLYIESTSRSLSHNGNNQIVLVDSENNSINNLSKTWYDLSGNPHSNDYKSIELESNGFGMNDPKDYYDAVDKGLHGSNPSYNDILAANTDNLNVDNTVTYEEVPIGVDNPSALMNDLPSIDSHVITSLTSEVTTGNWCGIPKLLGFDNGCCSCRCCDVFSSNNGFCGAFSCDDGCLDAFSCDGGCLDAILSSVGDGIAIEPIFY